MREFSLGNLTERSNSVSRINASNETQAAPLVVIPLQDTSSSIHSGIVHCSSRSLATNTQVQLYGGVRRRIWTVVPKKG